MGKKPIKKITHLIFACALLISLLSGFAIADVIWEPPDDFYMSHANECQYVNRSFYANGKNGYLEIFSKPGGISLGFSENGEIYHVQFSYKLGDEDWGVLEYSESGDKLVPRDDGDYKTGWIKLSDTVLKYDYLSFEEEHKLEYKPYDGDYTELSGIKNIVIWTFPRSGENCGTLDEIDNNFTVESVYTDSDGLKWGYISYYYGHKNFWVCLSDPQNFSIAAADIEIPPMHTPDPGFVPRSSSKDMTKTIIICISSVVLITAVLIVILGKKKIKAAK